MNTTALFGIGPCEFTRAAVPRSTLRSWNAPPADHETFVYTWTFNTGGEITVKGIAGALASIMLG